MQYLKKDALENVEELIFSYDFWIYVSETYPLTKI